MRAMYSWMVVLGVACSDGEETSIKTPHPQSETVAKTVDEPALELPPWERDPGPMNVIVPPQTHSVGHPVMDFSDYNQYPDPAQKATVLQGVAVGPIGDRQNAKVWLVSVHDHENLEGPPHLEAMMVYEVDCDDCPGEETTTLALESTRSAPKKRASIVGVESMRVEDVDKDGKFEVIAAAKFMPCCAGDKDRTPYDETVTFTAQRGVLVVLPAK